MAAFLTELLPRTLDPAIAWRPIDYGSKWALLDRLPRRLIGYARIAVAYRPLSLVLVDRDDDDCLLLKQKLEQACRHAGLHTISSPAAGNGFDVVNRIVIEELEAWFFGDGDALGQGWQGADKLLAQAPFRDPDAVRGGTHEALLRVLQRAGHMRRAERLPKIDVARTMGTLMQPHRNRSTSFAHFWSGLNALAANLREFDHA